MHKPKLIRCTTVPQSLNTFCKGMLKKLSLDYEVVGLSSPGESLDILGKREGVRTIAVLMERRISPLKDFISLIRLIKTFWRENPYIVHSMTPKAGLLCMLAAWFVRVPIRIHTFTGLVFPTASGLKRKVLIFTDWLTCACATHIIPEGEGVKNDLLNNHITKKQLKVLGYGNVRGVDMEFYARTPEVIVDANRIRSGYESYFTFVFVGRIVKDKGINELAEAFNRLNCKYPATRLLLVGRFEDDLDPISSETRQRIFSNQLICAVGAKADVRPWYAASDCLVFPSYREGFPNVVLEAGALGLPSIVTDINGSREIIIEEKNGYIVPPRNVDALYNAMERMLLNKETRTRMGGNARQLVAERFEQSFVHQCVIDFYKEVSNH